MIREETTVPNKVKTFFVRIVNDDVPDAQTALDDEVNGFIGSMYQLINVLPDQRNTEGVEPVLSRVILYSL
jgi:hypothetical protein